jgi:hypothetical protein
MRAGRAGLFLRLNMEMTLRSKSLRVLHLYVDVTLWALCLGVQACIWMFLSVHAYIQPHTTYIYAHMHMYYVAAFAIYLYNVAAVAVFTGTNHNLYCDYTSSRQCQRHRRLEINNPFFLFSTRVELIEVQFYLIYDFNQRARGLGNIPLLPTLKNTGNEPE